MRAVFVLGVDAMFENVAPIPPGFVCKTLGALASKSFIGAGPPPATGLAYGDNAFRKVNADELVSVGVGAWD